ncbi:MAG: hypothetical protein KQH57_18050 [Actinomycetales bacterium]|nr:hypothetical protein [Actinomycetales bacterium]
MNLTDALEQIAAGAAGHGGLADAELDSVLAETRRGRRWVTGTVLAGLAGAAAAGVLAVSLLDLGGTPPPPAAPTQTNAPTQTIAPSPTATPTATASTPSTSAPPKAEVLSTPTVDPLLPTAEPLTRGLLATTDASWLIVEVSATSDRQTYDRTVTANYLIDPTGVRYQLPDLPGDDPSLIEWLPGTSLALATENANIPIPAPISVVVVDLETGATTPVDLEGIAADAGLVDVDVRVAFAGDGTTDLIVSMSGDGTGLGERRTLAGEVTASIDGPVSLTPTPDGNLLLDTGTSSLTKQLEWGLAPQWRDPHTLKVRAPVELPGVTCWVEGWLDATGSVVASCPGSGWYVASPGASTWQLPLKPSTSWRGITPVVGRPDGTVVVAVEDGVTLANGSAAAPVMRMSATTATPVEAPVQGTMWVHGTVVVSFDEDANVSFADPGSESLSLISWDGADGATTVLVPPLAGPAWQAPSVVSGPGAEHRTWLYIDSSGALAAPVGD